MSQGISRTKNSLGLDEKSREFLVYFRLKISYLVSTVAKAYRVKQLWNSGHQGQFGCQLAGAKALIKIFNHSYET